VADEIIGRDAELQLVASFLDRLMTGPLALVMEGEVGIGKTTVWTAGVAAAHRKGYPILICRPVEAEATLSFAALGDLLDGVLDEVLPGLPGPQRRALEVAVLRADAGDDPADQRAVSVAVLGVLRLLARSGPLVVAVDDVQWLDQPSAWVLAFAFRRLTDEPVGILVSVRTTSRVAVPLGLDRALSPERLGRLAVDSLSLGALQRLVRSRLGSSLPRPVLLRIQEVTAGNPFFTLEVARALLQRRTGLEPGQVIPVPDNLRDLVRLRLAGLPTQACRALLSASALTRPTVSLIEQASPTPAQARRGLEKAADAGIVELDGDLVRFAHPLLRSVIYADASGEQRRRLHRRLAQAVLDPEEHARHLALATDGPDAGVAQTLEDAAGLARSRGAPAAAAELLELAGTRTPQGRAEDRWRRTLDAGRYHFEAGDTQRARTLLETTIATAASRDARARARLRLATVLHDSDGPMASIPVLEHALKDVGADRGLRMQVERELAHDRWLQGDLTAARRHARAAVELADGAGEQAALVTTVANETLLAAAAGGVTSEVLERARAAASAPGSSDAGQLTMLEPAKQVLALLLMMAGELEEARSIYLDELELASQQGADYRREYLTWCLARVEVRAGNFERAAGYAEESHLAAADQEGLLCETLAAKAEAAALLGQVEVARQAAEEGLAIAGRRGLGLAALRNRAALGFLELSVGNPQGAHRWLGPAVAAMHDIGLGEPAYVPLLPNEIEALIALGELEQATFLLDMLEERGQGLGRPWALAAAARGRGLLQAARGQQAAALEVFEYALLQHDRMAQPFELGRTLLVKGMVERRARRWGAARTSLEGALARFEELRAPLWADRARAELRRVGGRIPARHLTPTEEKVAALVSTGLSNQEVADALFMSVRTVEANLSRIYHKLGVRSRTQVHAKLSTEGPSS
jgi:DNA-binding CsgD family transcriptional regulator